MRAQSIFDCAEHDSGLYIKSEAVIQSKYVVTHLLHALQLGLRPDLVESLSQRHGRHDVCTSKKLFSLFAQTSEKLHLLRPTFFIDKCTDIAGRDPRQAFYCGKKSILARSTTLTSHLDLVSSRVCSVFFLYAFSTGCCKTPFFLEMHASNNQVYQCSPGSWSNGGMQNILSVVSTTQINIAYLGLHNNNSSPPDYSI